MGLVVPRMGFGRVESGRVMFFYKDQRPVESGSVFLNINYFGIIWLITTDQNIFINDRSDRVEFSVDRVG